jgi:hypothetical protein
MEVVREARGYVKTYGVKVNATASVIAQFDLHYRYREYAYESNTQSSNDIVIHDADKEMRNSYKYLDVDPRGPVRGVFNKYLVKFQRHALLVIDQRIGDKNRIGSIPIYNYMIELTMCDG